MIKERKDLKDKAFEARHLYKIGMISRQEAKEKIDPYVKVFNKTSKEVAKKYDQRPKLINFSIFVR